MGGDRKQLTNVQSFETIIEVFMFLNLFFYIYFLMIFLTFLATLSNTRRRSQICSSLFVKTIYFPSAQF